MTGFFSVFYKEYSLERYFTFMSEQQYDIYSVRDMGGCTGY